MRGRMVSIGAKKWGYMWGYEKELWEGLVKQRDV